MRLSQWLILLTSLAWPKDIPYTCIWRTDRDNKPLLTSSWMLHGSWQSLISPRAIHWTDSPIRLRVAKSSSKSTEWNHSLKQKRPPPCPIAVLPVVYVIGATSSSKDRDSSLESLEHYLKQSMRMKRGWRWRWNNAEEQAEVRDWDK